MWPTLSNRCIPVPRNNTLWAWDMCWDEWTVGGVANILALVKGLAAISGKFCTSLAIQLKSLVYFLQIPLLCKFACQNFAGSFVYKFMCWHIFRLGLILLLGWRWLCTARATGTSGFSGCSTGEVKCLSTLPDLCPSLPLATHNSLSLSSPANTMSKPYLFLYNAGQVGYVLFIKCSTLKGNFGQNDPTFWYFGMKLK